MPGLKKCYYEVLGVDRKAGDDEIKKSFRKLALQHHPDKNPDRAEEAKTEFQVIVRAYEVLSNPQERAWYDKHRQAVLREGLDPDFDDFNIDLIVYCSSSCFVGFGDDDLGFYSIYRELFAKLTAEELEAGWSDEHDEDIPNFGDSGSSYEDVVGPFYGFWESFCTVKTFAWNDEYDTRRAENRKIARLMDKENEKIRRDAKKCWNREVRALVDFVKRKDRRVIDWKIQEKAKLNLKQKELAKKAEESKFKRLAERKELLESVKSQKTHESKHQPVLKEMEKWMSKEFGEQLSGDSDEEEAPMCFHCAACNKSFKTEKAFINHEKSKKHLQEVEKLRELMKEDDELFDSDTENVENEVSEDDPTETSDSDSESPEDEIDATLEKVEELHIHSSCDDVNKNSEKSDHGAEDEEDADLLEKQFFARANRSKKTQPVFTPEEIDSDDNAQSINTHVNSDDDDKPQKKSNSKKAKKPKKPKGAQLPKPETVIPKSTVEPMTAHKKRGNTPVVEEIDSDDSEQSIETHSTSDDDRPKRKSNSKKGKKPKKPNAAHLPETAEAAPSGLELICITCNAKFPSRTKLFAHIKSTGHGVPLSGYTKRSKTAPQTEKLGKKRKNKKGE